MSIYLQIIRLWLTEAIEKCVSCDVHTGRLLIYDSVFTIRKFDSYLQSDLKRIESKGQP